MAYRSIVWMVFWATLLSGAAGAATPTARATLSLHEGNDAYAVGDAIVVDLTIDAMDAPLVIDRSTSTSMMSIDQIEISPAQGVYPWRVDSERFHPRWGDALGLNPPVAQFKTTLVLNRRFRIDDAGTYTIHVVTSRVKPAIATNDVSFTITRLSVDDERRRATELDRDLRAAPDERTASRLAEQIDWLSDDAATDVKLALLVGPTKSDCYFRHDTTGLWIARDRQRVIDRLEQAIVDPAEDIPMGSTLLETLVALKIALRHPDLTDANVPMAPRHGNVWRPGPFEDETDQLMAGYIDAIERTLPLRTGPSLSDAEQRVSRGRRPTH